MKLFLIVILILVSLLLLAGCTSQVGFADYALREVRGVEKSGWAKSFQHCDDQAGEPLSLFERLYDSRSPAQKTNFEHRLEQMVVA